MKQYDVTIIGFGKGGKLLSSELAKRKRKRWRNEGLNMLFTPF